MSDDTVHSAVATRIKLYIYNGVDTMLGAMYKLKQEDSHQTLDLKNCTLLPTKKPELIIFPKPIEGNNSVLK